MTTDERIARLRLVEGEASGCTRCVEPRLLHSDHRGCARPLFTRGATGAMKVIIVGEAPNDGDTFDPDKGYLTYDATTDPTGRFMRALLLEEARLCEDELDGVIFTNAVLCLPRKQGERFPVTARQLANCSPWLRRLIDDSGATVVVTMGATALRSLRLVEPHRLQLKTHAGGLHDWYGRKLLPLYHAGLLGRITRSEQQQRADMRALSTHLGRGVQR